MSKPHKVELKVLKPFADLKPPGDVAYFEVAVAEKLILKDAAEFVEDDFDRAIEDGFRKYPQAIAALTEYVDACAEERERRRKK